MDRPVLCALCRARPVDARWRPFCSRRCQTQDRARWADGTYRVEAPPGSLPTARDADDDTDG